LVSPSSPDARVKGSSGTKFSRASIREFRGVIVPMTWPLAGFEAVLFGSLENCASVASLESSDP
jgi:hypothetical protein